METNKMTWNSFQELCFVTRPRFIKTKMKNVIWKHLEDMRSWLLDMVKALDLTCFSPFSHSQFCLFGLVLATLHAKDPTSGLFTFPLSLSFPIQIQLGSSFRKITDREEQQKQQQSWRRMEWWVFWREDLPGSWNEMSRMGRRRNWEWAVNRTKCVTEEY